MENSTNVTNHACEDSVSAFRIRLRSSMDALHISCCALAKSSAVPEKTVRNILQGVAADPRLSTIVRLMSAVGGDANWMLGLSQKNTQPSEVKHHEYCCEACRNANEQLASEFAAYKKNSRRTRVLAAVFAALFFATLIIIIYVLWDALHLDKGIFRV